jgi:2-polyprenyl-3-methyl-5-hydroxy-6-metoxy-1,4-benzoquinol methylase
VTLKIPVGPVGGCLHGLRGLRERRVLAARARPDAGLQPWLAARAQQFGPRLVAIVPAPLRPRLAEVHRPVARHLAAARYRRRYGEPFMSNIDYADDLLQYSLGVAAPRPALRYYDAVRMYFQGGEWNAAEMAEALREHGFPLAGATSVLEFACGWGRVTRHLVHLLDRNRLTVSDVDPVAVHFVCNKLDVRGFKSAIDPRDLRHRARYDVILIVSLFSHLPLADWGPWLGRLGELLEPGGALAFSTHGMHAFGVDGSDAEREAFDEVAEGFFYRTANETRGRLSTDHYGLSYVAEGRVRDLVGRNFPGSIVAACPRKLNGYQDVYVLERDDAPDRAGGRRLRNIE